MNCLQSLDILLVISLISVHLQTAKCVSYNSLRNKQLLQNQLKGSRRYVPLKRVEYMAESIGENPFEAFQLEEEEDGGSVIGKRSRAPMSQKFLHGKRNNKNTGHEDDILSLRMTDNNKNPLVGNFEQNEIKPLLWPRLFSFTPDQSKEISEAKRNPRPNFRGKREYDIAKQSAIGENLESGAQNEQGIEKRPMGGAWSNGFQSAGSIGKRVNKPPLMTARANDDINGEIWDEDDDYEMMDYMKKKSDLNFLNQRLGKRSDLGFLKQRMGKRILQRFGRAPRKLTNSSGFYRLIKRDPVGNPIIMHRMGKRPMDPTMWNFLLNQNTN